MRPLLCFFVIAIYALSYAGERGVFAAAASGSSESARALGVDDALALEQARRRYAEDLVRAAQEPVSRDVLDDDAQLVARAARRLGQRSRFGSP